MPPKVKDGKTKFAVNRGTGVPSSATATVADRRKEREESTATLIPVGSVPEDGSAGSTVFVFINPDQLADDPENNPTHDRTRIDDLSDLASITTVGILQPLLVVPAAIYLDEKPQYAEQIGDKPYVIRAGHRRKLAAKKFGLSLVPIYIRTDMNSKGNASIVRLVENLARATLNPIAEALEYQRLRDEYGYIVTEIGELVGWGHSRVSKRLGLLDLPPVLQAALVISDTAEKDGDDPAGDAPRRLRLTEAFELRRVPDPEVMLVAWDLMRADKEINVHAAVAKAPDAIVAAAAAPKQRESGETTTQKTKGQPAPFQAASAARFPYCEKLIAAEHDQADVLQVLAHHSIDGAPSHRDAVRIAHRWLVKAGIGPADLRNPAAYIAAVGPADLVRVAFAIAIAADEVRLRNPQRVWDHRDAAHLTRLQAVGYTPTEWETERLSAVTIAH